MNSVFKVHTTILQSLVRKNNKINSRRSSIENILEEQSRINDSKKNSCDVVLSGVVNQESDTPLDSISNNTKLTSRAKPTGDYITGPLHSGIQPPQFQPIIMKRSFHIKQTHDLLELQKQKKELERQVMMDNLHSP